MENSIKKKEDNIVYEEVNYSDLIDIGRKYVNNEDVKLGEYFINLSLLSPNLDRNSKIQALAIKSFIHYKKKDTTVLLSEVQKVLKFVQNTKWESIETNILLCAIRTLYRGGSILTEMNQPFCAVYLMYYNKNLFSLRGLRDEKESYSLIENSIQSLNKTILTELMEIKSKYNVLENKNAEEICEKLNKFKMIFSRDKNCNVDEATNKINSSGEDFYLISIIWIKNLLTFIEKFEKFCLMKSEKYSEFFDKAFNKTNVVNLTFREEADNDFSQFGIYPSNINNFNIIQFEDSLFDPDEQYSHTNIFLKKGAKENVDYFYLNKEEWNILKSEFGFNFEILRKTAKLSNEFLIEVNLRKFKLLIINDRLREHNIDMLKPFNIQISKAENIKCFKEKIKRCLEFILKEEIVKGINLYLFNFGLKNNKRITFELIYAYKNKTTSFSLKAEEITNEVTLIGDLSFGPGDLLIAEVDTNFITPFSETKTCSLCTKLTQNEEYKCSQCERYIYCSEDCKRGDTIHQMYHSNLNKLFKRKFNLKQLAEVSMSDLLERGSKHGLVGLKNLGNTCFMNSALQCLSACEELTKYFLTKRVFDEINRSNSHGTGGEVAKAYYELVKELWQGDSHYLCPTDFRQIFVRFVRQFAGFSQHDSHEMLTFMLDTLHEDLNRVKQKPYVEISEKSDKETEVEASSRWWKNHITRENSIIVDLFYGQYKSTITCPECSRISITYDPFSCLGLPIPSGHSKIRFKFIPYSGAYIYEYDLPVNSNTVAKDLKIKVNRETETNNEDLEAVLLSKEKAFKKVLKDEDVVYSLIDSGYEVVIYKKYPDNVNPSDINEFVSFYLHPVLLIQERSMLFMKKTSPKLLSYPNIISVNKKAQIEELHQQIFKLYTNVLNIKSEKYDFYKVLEASESHPFTLHIINNLPESSGFFSAKAGCEFCGSKCEYCLLLKGGFDLSKSVLNLIRKQSVNRPFLIYVEFKESKLTPNSSIYKNLDFGFLFSASSKNLISKFSSVNIYDCIDLFRSEERLEKENAWYCSKCKNHQEAFKRMEIYKPPNYLIVQFKRFKIKSNNTVMGMIANKKIDGVIDYPVEGLDLREYVVGDEKESAIYDLFAISQHFGGLSSGHYTALCKNFDKWYEFDDDRVTKENQSDVVNGYAYILFYKKRSFNL